MRFVDKTTMTRTVLRHAYIGLSLALLAPASASAQVDRGEMGQQSRATIRIAVIVAPRFRVDASRVKGDRTNVSARPFTIASNAAGLRYSLVADTAIGAVPLDTGSRLVTEPASLAPSSDRSRAQNRTSLVIVVPD